LREAAQHRQFPTILDSLVSVRLRRSLATQRRLALRRTTAIL
jgi:hypothetical protein